MMLFDAHSRCKRTQKYEMLGKFFYSFVEKNRYTE